MQKIIDKAVLSDGTKIQLEDWHSENSEKYPDLYGYMIGAYPKAKNTAKENSLEYVDSFETGKRNILFDFSLLDNTDKLTDEEKQYIREHALRNLHASDCEQFYGKEFDNFTVCNGRALYYQHKIYDENGCERRYVIMQLAKIIHTRGTQKSVYDDYETTEIKLDSGYTEPVRDYEI